MSLGIVDRVIVGFLERRFYGAAVIQGVVVCDSAGLVFAEDEGEDASFSTVQFGWLW